MGLFDRTPERLATGPTLVVSADTADAVADLVRSYDPAWRRRKDRFCFENGVQLHGPVELTPELAAKTGLPTGQVGYHTGTGVMLKRAERPEDAKLLDGEYLVRGLAARLPGAKHSERPWADVRISVSVFAEHQVPAEQVIAVLQPFAGDEDGRQLFIDPHETVEDSYFLISEREPVFFTSFWPSRLARSKTEPPPPALGPLRTREPCRWQVFAALPAATADAEIRTLLGRAALALAKEVGGTVTDMFGFPVDKPEDVLAG